VRAAYAAFLPSLSVSAGATRQLPSGGSTRIENGQVITVPRDPWSSSLGLGANLELFDGGRRFFEVREAKAREDVADANEITQSYAVALSAKQAYYDVLAARESQGAAQAQLDEAEQQHRSVVARVRARVATRSDSLRAEIQLRNAKLAISDVARSLELANASLMRAVGSPEPVTAQDQAALDPPSLALDDEQIRSLALAGPFVQQAQAQVEAAQSVRRISWTSYLPSLNASYSRSGSGSGSGIALGGDEFSYSGQFRLSLSLPIFNQLQRESQVTQAQVAENNAEAALRDARLAAHESVTRSLNAFRSAAERVESQTATVAAAEEDLRVQQQRYAAGGSTLLDVLTSQTQLDQARRDLIRARYDQRVAEAELEALIGRDV
jgi:outer membrane protein